MPVALVYHGQVQIPLSTGVRRYRNTHDGLIKQYRSTLLMPR